MSTPSALTLAACVLLVPAVAAYAGPGGTRYPISDEIQVYTDEINGRGEYGLEMHINTTPSGATEPAYPGAAPPAHGWRITPEFSYGIGHDLELGLYLPTTTNPQTQQYEFGGVKLRVKWMPLKPEEGGSGWFAGANVELSDLNKSFSESRYSTELRLIGGYRAERWLVAFNPILDWALSNGYRGAPELTLAFKASYQFWPGIGIGPEYYNTAGPLGSPVPASQQDRVLYLAFDVDRGPVPFNFGIGRGLNSASDKWTIKAILDIPLP